MISTKRAKYMGNGLSIKRVTVPFWHFSLGLCGGGLQIAGPVSGSVCRLCIFRARTPQDGQVYHLPRS